MIIYYECEKCNNSIKKHFRKSKDIVETIDCECGGKLERQLSAPTSKMTQVIDNGVQARKVEIMNEVVEKETQRMLNGDKK